MMELAIDLCVSRTQISQALFEDLGYISLVFKIQIYIQKNKSSEKLMHKL